MNWEIPPFKPTILLSFFLTGAFSIQSHAQIPNIERNALVALYTSTDGTNWKNSASWNGPLGSECEWHGVSCYNSHVSAINLSNNQLTGTIPSEIGDLQYLKTLSLWTNELTGSIPTEIGKLKDLTSLNLAVNKLTGNIPSGIENLSNLTSLQLYRNDFTGNIPPLSLFLVSRYM